MLGWALPLGGEYFLFVCFAFALHAGLGFCLWEMIFLVCVLHAELGLLPFGNDFFFLCFACWARLCLLDMRFVLLCMLG